MIPPEVAARVRLLTQELVAEQRPADRVEALHRLTPVTPVGRELPQVLQQGALFRATIERPLPNGTFVALVAGQEMTLAIDRPLKSGDTLELVVARREGNQVWAREAAPTPAPPSSPGGTPPAARTEWSHAATLVRQLLTSASPQQPLPVAVAPREPPTGAETVPSAVTPTPSATPAPSAAPPATAAVSLTTPPAPPPDPRAPQLPTSATPSATSLSSPSAAATPATAPAPPSPSGTGLPTPPAAGMTAAPDGTAAAKLPPYLALRTTLAPLDGQLKSRAAPLTAQQLADTLRTSGLFYEAHLAQWVAGRYPLAELLREPQIATRAPNPPAADRSSAQGLLTLVQRLLGFASPAEPNPNPLSSALSAAPAPARAQNATAAAASAAAASASAANASTEATLSAEATPSAVAPQRESTNPPIPERLVPIVQRQIDALVHGRVELLFSPWAGSTVRWQIDSADEAPHHTAKQEAAERPWQSQLTVTTETLGTITFWLSVAAQRIAVAVGADQPETEAPLKARMKELLEAFAADGLPLTQLEWRPPPTNKEEGHG